MNDVVQGGWFDAGDHVKFNMPMAYSAAILGWGLLEYGDNLSELEKTEVNLNVQYALDYLVACDTNDIPELGITDEVVCQVGVGGPDHKWWGSPEIAELEVKYGEMGERAIETTDSTCVTGQMSAALTVGYLICKEDYPEKADLYLEKARHYFELANTSRSDEDYMATEAATGNFYKSWSPVWDQLFWSAVWLYKATGEEKYLDLCKECLENTATEEQSTTKKFTWPFSWDDVTYGAEILYIQETGDEEVKGWLKNHLDWAQGIEVEGKAAKNYEGVEMGADNWGTLRYANNDAFIMNVAIDTLDFGAEYETAGREWATYQTNYCLGDNSNNYSYVVGFGEDFPQQVHHRGAFGGVVDEGTQLAKMEEATNSKGYAHILYGALAGGPSQSGIWIDQADKYENTEVATDYNAAYTGNLMCLIGQYKGERMANFPPEEVPNRLEFYTDAVIGQDQDFFTGLKIKPTNHSAYPARYLENPTFRYFFDITEVLAAGYTVDDLYTQVDYDRYKDVVISEKPVQYDGNIYYVQLSYDHPDALAPMGQEQHACEVQFRVGLPDGSAEGSWDPSNDYSYQGLTTGEAYSVTDRICIYDGNKLIYGVEPDGTEAVFVPREIAPLPMPGDDGGTDPTTSEPTSEPSSDPTSEPSSDPTSEPSSDPTSEPSSDPTTSEPTSDPTTSEPSSDPTTSEPSSDPTSSEPTSSGELPTGNLCGDVNLDGLINVADLVALCKHVVGVVGADLTGQGLANSDCDGDGVVNSDADDALYLAQFIVKKINVLPFK
jgi:hypothetical protein